MTKKDRETLQQAIVKLLNKWPVPKNGFYESQPAQILESEVESLVTALPKGCAMPAVIDVFNQAVILQWWDKTRGSTYTLGCYPYGKMVLSYSRNKQSRIVAKYAEQLGLLVPEFFSLIQQWDSA